MCENYESPNIYSAQYLFRLLSFINKALDLCVAELWISPHIHIQAAIIIEWTVCWRKNYECLSIYSELKWFSLKRFTDTESIHTKCIHHLNVVLDASMCRTVFLFKAWILMTIGLWDSGYMAWDKKHARLLRRHQNLDLFNNYAYYTHQNF